MSMSTRQIFYFLVVLFNTILQAQTFTIVNGYVLTPQGNPVEGIRIYNSYDPGGFLYTDENGFYSCIGFIAVPFSMSVPSSNPSYLSYNPESVSYTAAQTSLLNLPYNQNFIATPAAPSAAQLSSPPDNSIDIPVNSLLFQWDPKGGHFGVTFQLQVSTDPNFGSAVVNVTDIALDRYSVSGLTNSTTYYWKVKSSNESGSAWSEVFSFTTVLPPPEQPILSAPSNNSTGETLTPTLSWNTASTASSYRIQVSNTPDFSSSIFDQSGISSTSQAVNSLKVITKYYWRVNATNAGGTSAWSDVWSFTTLAAIPATPILSSPNNGTTGLVANPIFRWHTVTGVDSYTFQVSIDENFSTTVIDMSGLTDTMQAVTELENITTYYWKVNAINAVGTSAWSDTWNFTTIINLAAYYPFNGNANDSSGNGNNGIVSGAILTTDRFGNDNCSYSFDGSNDAIVASSSSLLEQTNNRSISLWIQSTKTGDQGIAGYIGLDGHRGYLLMVHGNGKFAMMEDNYDGVNGAWANAFSDEIYAADNQWHHLVGVRRNDTTYLYVDNVCQSQPTTLGATYSNDSKVFIGEAKSGFQNFEGKIDEVRFYNYAMTESQITTLFNLNPFLSPPNLPSPVTETIGVAVNPTLSWNAVNGADSFTVQISTDQSFSTTIIDKSGVTDTSYVVIGLAYNTLYYWRVKAIDADGTSEWSCTWNYTTIIAAPTLTSPSNESTGEAVNQILSWNATTTGADSYTVQVSTVSDFTSTVIDQSGITGTSYSASGLDNNTQYYWRVNATNAGGTSSWSTAWDFTTIVAAPLSPTLFSPTDGATGVAVDPTFGWDGSSGIDSYQIQISTVSDFASTVMDQSGITDTWQAISGLENNTKYYWRVNATNVVGTSAWADTWDFTTIVAAPLSPTLSAPSNGATGVAVDPTLTWNAASEADSYAIQVSPDQNFTSTAIDQSGITDAFYSTSGLSNNTQYYWRVNATNAGGTSSWSTAWNFTTIVAAPLSPTLSSPSDGATAVAIDPTLNWNTSSGADSYAVQVSTVSDFTSTIIDQSGITNASYSASGLDNDMQYYWRVNATNAGGTSSWSTAWDFTTIGAAPLSPTLSAPSNGATGVAVDPTLTWNAASEADSYAIQVSPDQNFTSTAIDQIGITDAFYSASGLDNYTQYYWRVNATNAGGTSSWSTAWNFTTDNPVNINVFPDKELQNFRFLIYPSIVDKSQESTCFFYESINHIDATLNIYDCIGNVMFKSDYSLKATTNESTPFGHWNLRNLSGKRVAGGTYLVVLRIKTTNGDIKVFKKMIGVKEN